MFFSFRFRLQHIRRRLQEFLWTVARSTTTGLHPAVSRDATERCHAGAYAHVRGGIYDTWCWWQWKQRAFREHTAHASLPRRPRAHTTRCRQGRSKCEIKISTDFFRNGGQKVRVICDISRDKGKCQNKIFFKCNEFLHRTLLVWGIKSSS